MTDEGSWASQVERATSAYGDLMAPSTNLLVRAESNQSAPRVSNEQSLKARRILRKYSREVLYRTPVLNNIGTFTDSTDSIQFKCITETCPTGATCVPLPLRKEGEEFASDFKRFRQLFNETMTWAKEVSHLKRNVPHFIKKYNQAERKLEATLQELPVQIYVIDAKIPRK